MDKEKLETELEQLNKEKAHLDELMRERDVKFISRWMQTSKNDHVKETQTDAVGVMTSFGHISDGGEQYIGADDTQNSTNLNLTQDGFSRGRVQSASRGGRVDGSFSNIMSHHGPS